MENKDVVGPDREEQMLDLTTVVSDLLRTNHIDQATADDIFARQRTSEQTSLHPLEYLEHLDLDDLKRPGEKLGIEFLSEWLAELSGQDYYPIDPLKIDVAAVTSIMSYAFAIRHKILAVEVSHTEVVIASAQPWHRIWEDNLRHVCRREIRRVVANPKDISRYTIEFYRLAESILGASSDVGTDSNSLNSFEQMLELGDVKTPDANDRHIVNIVDWLLQYAFEQRTSDIHIEPRRTKFNLRFRIDGTLHTIYQMPDKVAAAVVSRFKILGRMNIAEKRKPQDGRLKTRNCDGFEVELRLSTLPTVFGEKLVIRVFDPQVLVKSFNELGFLPDDEKRWRTMSTQPYGIILVTGPTGSGKTTTLYSTLKQLATNEVNVCTIEDPIEMVEPSFNQMQVQHNIDLSFASGLRAILRQDPDIIMVGEIRDLETAEMAFQAALTGHLVLSTLHTNDSPSALTRLLDLGIPAYLIRSTVLGVMAQRLVRTLCSSCKEKVSLDSDDWKALTKGWTLAVPSEVYRSVGCSECRNTGYHGRIGLYEILTMSEKVKALVTEDPDITLLYQQCFQEGMHSLRRSGAHKVGCGLTSIEEVMRMTTDVE